MFVRSWLAATVRRESYRPVLFLSSRPVALAMAALLLPLCGSGFAGAVMTLSLDTPHQTVPEGTTSVWFSGQIDGTIAGDGGGAPMLDTENVYIDGSFDHALLVGNYAQEYFDWILNTSFSPGETYQYIGRLFELVIGPGDPPGLYNHSSASISDLTVAFLAENNNLSNRSNSVVYSVTITPAAVPEVDPASAGLVAALVTGFLGLCERRRRMAIA